MPEYHITPEESGQTLISFLSSKVPAAPQGFLRQLIKAGKVQNQSGALEYRYRTVSNDLISLPQSKRLLELIEASEKIPQVLYESREILIVAKPSGLAVHSSKGHEHDNLNLRVQEAQRQELHIAPVHRLDLETSGPVLFGKGKKSCSELGKLMMSGGIAKTYLALVQGQTDAQGELNDQVEAKGKIKDARSSYRTITSSTQASLVEITLDTGRQHQIRKQLSAIGHPLFGDKRYGGPCPQQLLRMFLHCNHLSLNDPFVERKIEVEMELPEELVGFLEFVGIAVKDNLNH